jgi:hypothetical protein
MGRLARPGVLARHLGKHHMRKTRAIVIVAAAAIVVIALVVVSVHNRDAEGTAYRSISGELVRYDVLDGHLTLRSAEGAQDFAVQVGTPVHQGARSISLADLRWASGCRAKVWYRDAQSQLTATEIRISCGPETPGPGSLRP